MNEDLRFRLGLGHAASALLDASTQLTLAFDQVPAAEREVLKDIRWHAAEAQRLLRHLIVSIDRSAASLLTPPHEPAPADVGAAPAEPPQTAT